MDRGVRIGAADGSPAGPAHAPRPHPGDERRKLPVERQQAPTPREASLLVTVCFTAPICRVGFRSGLSAPRKSLKASPNSLGSGLLSLRSSGLFLLRP